VARRQFDWKDRWFVPRTDPLLQFIEADLGQVPDQTLTRDDLSRSVDR
jgi:hypothetical protein